VWRELRACDYGAPTTRKRLFVIARNDGDPIVWPEPTHGPGRPLPYRTASECIDWSLPCPSIFGRKKPLAENTEKRIFRGLRRYVIDSPKPFIVSNMTNNVPRPVDEPVSTLLTGNHKFLVSPALVPITHHGDRRVHPGNEPAPTITGAHRGELALMTPYLARIGQTGGKGKYVNGVDEPVTTITTQAEHLVIAPTLIQTGFGEREGQAPRALDIEKPLGTVMAGGAKHVVVASWLAKHYGDKGQAPGSKLDDPISTVTAVDHHSLVNIELQELPRAIAPQSIADNSCPFDGYVNDSEVVTAAHIQRDFGRSVGTPADEPVGATTAGGSGKQALVASHLVKLRGGLNDHHTTAQGLDTPVPTITAGGTHLGEVRAFLTRYTDGEPLTPQASSGLVMVDGEQYVVVDIGMRMLSPRELYRAQGFPDSYKIEILFNGKVLSKTAQVRMCGNSVCPDMGAALVRAQAGPAPAYALPVAA
jgi:DNA (cytosine-5)-methyltransferase 1